MHLNEKGARLKRFYSLELDLFLKKSYHKNMTKNFALNEMADFTFTLYGPGCINTVGARVGIAVGRIVGLAVGAKVGRFPPGEYVTVRS